MPREQHTDQEHKHDRHHRNSDEKFEAEVKQFTEDPAKLAREILSLKKELNRLHYKVKTYQESNRSLQIISVVTTFILLGVIVAKLYSGK
ncbi:hypothetical protein [Phnomibacter sp. MR]|uniref:hypothetical protein n=1 Tax=Phnomibacter sp. MR TaxID=3042318 RepID=UPI003A811C1F